MTQVHERERQLHREVAETVQDRLPDVDVLAVELSGPERICVYIDHPNGVDHALCENVTNALRRYLDRYSLEVSSPGFERPLRTRDHFAEAVGRTVSVRTDVEVSGRKFDVRVIGPPFGGAVNGAVSVGARKPQRAQRADSGGGAGADELVSPLQGNMWKILVEQGQTVEEGQLVCIVEAMKMENEITAHKAGVVEQLAVKEGDAVSSGATIAVIKSPA